MDEFPADARAGMSASATGGATNRGDYARELGQFFAELDAPACLQGETVHSGCTLRVHGLVPVEIPGELYVTLWVPSG